MAGAGPHCGRMIRDPEGSSQEAWLPGSILAGNGSAFTNPNLRVVASGLARLICPNPPHSRQWILPRRLEVVQSRAPVSCGYGGTLLTRPPAGPQFTPP